MENFTYTNLKQQAKETFKIASDVFNLKRIIVDLKTLKRLLTQQVKASNARFDTFTEDFGNALIEIQHQLSPLIQEAGISTTSSIPPTSPKPLSDSKPKGEKKGEIFKLSIKPSTCKRNQKAVDMHESHKADSRRSYKVEVVEDKGSNKVETTVRA